MKSWLHPMAQLLPQNRLPPLFQSGSVLLHQKSEYKMGLKTDIHLWHQYFMIHGLILYIFPDFVIQKLLGRLFASQITASCYCVSDQGQLSRESIKERIKMRMRQGKSESKGPCTQKRFFFQYHNVFHFTLDAANDVIFFLFVLWSSAQLSPCEFQ